MNLTLLFLGLSIGNFAYQAMAEHDWLTALDRTFYQGVALIGAHIAMRLAP